MLSPLPPAVAADVCLGPRRGVHGEKVMDSAPPPSPVPTVHCHGFMPPRPAAWAEPSEAAPLPSWTGGLGPRLCLQDAPED